MAFSTKTHFSALSSHDYEEAMHLGGSNAADMVQVKPPNPDNTHSASHRAVDTCAEAGQEHELNHFCFCNDVAQMVDL